MSAHPKLLTIRGLTMGMKEWSKQPGAAKYHTIVNRLLIMGWEPEQAVFVPVTRSRRRVRPVAVTQGIYRHRPAVRLRSNPHRPNPHPPCVGGFRSWPIEALDLLRRVA